MNRNQLRTILPAVLILCVAGCGVAEDDSLDLLSSEETALTLESTTPAVFNGSLSAAGVSWAAHPITLSSPGTVKATLNWSNAGADFNLFLADLDANTNVGASNGSARPEVVELHLPAGNYRLGVKAKTGASDYALTVVFTPDTLKYSATGTINQAQSWKTFTFPANQGDSVKATVSWNTSADLNAFLYAPTAGLQDGTSGSMAKPEVVEAVASESGTWRVGVKAVSGSATYSITVEVTAGGSTTPPPPPCQPRFAGDPACAGKMYYGASVQGGDPTAFESSLGRKLSVFRSYFSPNDAPSKLANRATNDLQNGRIPLMSTKVPSNDWAGVGAGNHDAWLLGIINALAQVQGPVWLALHHEPRGDGNPADWVKMQQRARTLIDANSTNIALVGILNGYSFLANNPDADGYNHPVGTGVHVMGFDSYCQWSPTEGGTWRPADVVLSPGVMIAQWGYPTLVGEYGVRTDPANPGKAAQWMEDAYNFAYSNGFVAISYFNSGANSPDGTWELDGERLNAFKTLLARPEVARP